MYTRCEWTYLLIQKQLWCHMGKMSSHGAFNNVPQDWFEANLQHQKCFFDRVRIRRRKNLWVSQSSEKSSICLAIRASSPIMFNKFLNHYVTICCYFRSSWPSHILRVRCASSGCVWQSVFQTSATLSTSPWYVCTLLWLWKHTVWWANALSLIHYSVILLLL